MRFIIVIVILVLGASITSCSKKVTCSAYSNVKKPRKIKNYKAYEITADSNISFYV
jgi:hypothetical protein